MDRLKSNLRIIFVSGCVAVGLFALALQIWSAAEADNYDRSDPQLALQWSPANVNALLELAGERLDGASSEEDVAGAEELARRALLAMPLSTGAVRLLGLVAAERDQEERARALIIAAAQRWWYDAEAQLLAAAYYLDADDLSPALYHLDGLLRSRPGFRDAVFPVLSSLAADPTAAESMAELLSTFPPWRSSLLEQFFSEVEDLSAASDFLSALRARSAGPTSRELSSWVARLIREGNVQKAYADWVDSLPATERPADTEIYNGDFERPISGIPFDWVLGNVAGAVIEIVNRPDRVADRALRVEFLGRRVRFLHVTKVLQLLPGAHRLTILANADQLRSERGLIWLVSCLSDGRELSSTNEFLGDTDWVTLELSFTVPSSGCSAQQLQLRSAARIAVEEEISGRVWFDEVAVHAVLN